MSNFKQGRLEGSTVRPAAQIQMCEAWLAAGQGDLPNRHNIRAAMHLAREASQRLDGCLGWGKERAALVALWKIATACAEALEEREREAAGKGESEAREYATAAEPRLAELYHLSEPR